MRPGRRSCLQRRKFQLPLEDLLKGDDWNKRGSELPSTRGERTKTELYSKLGLEVAEQPPGHSFS